jgi:hypothetical protein
MPFDPALPANGALISALELRNQLTSLNDRADAQQNDLANKAPIPGVALLSQTISNPPTQAQVQTIQNKINELITALSP